MLQQKSGIVNLNSTIPLGHLTNQLNQKENHSFIKFLYFNWNLATLGPITALQ